MVFGMGDGASAPACKVSQKTIILPCLNTPPPICICADGNERGSAMNDKTVGGEAHSVIRCHAACFTKQMLDI